MNKKIKIIELLQDFADEKEIIMPKYIRYWDRIGHKDEIMLVCKANIIDKLDDCKIDLNDEVEILEDNTEEIEELAEWVTRRDGEVTQQEGKRLEMCYKIDELVKAVNSIRKDKNNDYISKDKIKAKIEENKWSIEHYDCDEADYKQSQAVGAWNVLQSLLEEKE